MQRLISSESGVKGSIPSNKGSKESPKASSLPLEKALIRLAASNKEQSERSSLILSVPPISKRFREASTSWMPEKEMLHF